MTYHDGGALDLGRARLTQANVGRRGADEAEALLCLPRLVVEGPQQRRDSAGPGLANVLRELDEVRVPVRRRAAGVGRAEEQQPAQADVEAGIRVGGRVQPHHGLRSLATVDAGEGMEQKLNPPP